jgi:drug/metabolite transporter (DMT)-like permease
MLAGAGAAAGSKGRARLVAAFVAVYFVWGSTYLAIRVVLETLPPFLAAAARFLAAGGALYLYARLRGASRPTAASWRWAALIGGLMLLMGNGAVMWAEQRIPSGPAALIVATEPLLIVLLQGVLPTGALLVGLVLGVSGVAILVGPGILGGGQPLDPVATLVVVIGSASWAAGSLLGRRAVVPGNGLLGAGMQMLCGAAFLGIVGVIHGDVAHVHVEAISLRSLVALAYLVGFGSIVAFTAYGYLLRNASPSLVSTYAFVNPVVAVALGSLLGHEPLNGRVMVASLVIVSAVVLITLTQNRRGRLRPTVSSG